MCEKKGLRDALEMISVLAHADKELFYFAKTGCKDGYAISCAYIFGMIQFIADSALGSDDI